VNLKFNDYVLCKTPFGKIIAKFMMQRPDNKEVIIDFQNRLHQLPNKNVQYATNEHLYEFIQSKINELLITKQVSEESIETFTKAIAECKPELAKLKRKSKTTNKKLDANGVLLRLMEANRQKETEQYIKLSNDDFDLMNDESERKKRILDIESRIRNAENGLARSNDTLISVNKDLNFWQTKEDKLINEDIRDIERGEY
jgi:hypothetical protein